MGRDSTASFGAGGTDQGIEQKFHGVTGEVWHLQLAHGQDKQARLVNEPIIC
jgi:hypothetical protein